MLLKYNRSLYICKKLAIIEYKTVASNDIFIAVCELGNDKI